MTATCRGACSIIAIAESRSDFNEECCIDADVFACSDSGMDVEVVALEKLAKTVTVDQIDRWAPSRVASLFASEVNEPVVMSSPLSPRPAIAPRKSRTALGPKLPR